jgi:hypothetical protein
VKEHYHHWASQQDSTQLKILIALKKLILNTSVLTLTKQHMHVIHVNNLILSVGHLTMMVIIG